MRRTDLLNRTSGHWEDWRICGGLDGNRDVYLAVLISDLDNSVYLIGGASPRTDEYIYQREVWRYTVSTDSWDEIKVPEWVDPLDGVWMEGNLYVFGECAAGASCNPKSDSWAQLPPGNMPSAGKVYTAGRRIMIGQVELHPSLRPYVWIYDPSGEQAPADAGQSIGWGGGNVADQFSSLAGIFAGGRASGPWGV